MKQERVVELSDYVINNDGEADLDEQIDKVLVELNLTTNIVK